ncbi:MAG TPA: protein kinase [Gemmataceae bacterium]|nr:protein kinase [Gemmataceae bacterium]
MPQANVDRTEGSRCNSLTPSDGAALAFGVLAPGAGPDSWGDSRRDAGPVRLGRESDNTDAKLAKLTEGIVAFPQVGQEFLGRFRLIGELGRGAFARVYLARDRELADRLVALKISTDCYPESQKLARLHHTNIVEVYSRHEAGPLHAVVMPYCGATTLADVLDDLGLRESLPASGKGLVSTLNTRRTKSGLVPPLQPSPHAREGQSGGASAPVSPSAQLETQPEAPVDGPIPLATLRNLEGMSYVEAVLWMGAKLADGLAHAHERGILHRDLKPANILLTDEGQPMLLDFNLAEDVPSPLPLSPSDGERGEGRVGARVGGTLPYMAPEHLAAYQGRPVDVDARSDVYSLGVILYEMLTGRHPFPKHPIAPLPLGERSDGKSGALEKMMQDRLRLPPSARSRNRAVTPAVDSILRRCLAPVPARRYQTAAELREDLDRQGQHLPLRYAPDPSLRERLGKWLRRNPRAISATRIGVVAGVLLLLLTAGLYWRGEQLARYESADRLQHFRDDYSTARLLLGARAADMDERAEGREAARRAVDRYNVDADGRWREQSSFRRLSAEEKARVQTELGEALVLLASAEAGAPNLAEALRLNRLAETCYPAGQAPRALWTQRAELQAGLGHAEEAKQLRETAAAAPVRGDSDVYLLAREEAGQGRLGAAADSLRAVAAREPDNFAVQFLMGNCCLDGYIDELGQDADAVGCYSACIAMRPDFHAAYANRGLMRLRRGMYTDGEADFTRAIQLRPDRADYFLNRAQAYEGLHRDLAELDDLNQAEELGSKAVLLYYLRAAVHQRMGHDVSTRRDLDRVLKLTPDDEAGYIARGLARAADGDGEGAVADFTEAIKRNPNSVPALQDQARALGQLLKRNREALTPLNRLLELYPEFAAAYGARAVMRARLGMRDGALADIKKAQQLDPNGGATLYQAASTYALLGGDGDQAEAFRMLCRALEKGYGWMEMESDDDLASLREDARYGDLVRTSGLLQVGGR